MRVCLVLSSSVRAGAELFVCNLAAALHSNSISVKVVLLQEGEIVQLLSSAGIDHCVIPVRSCLSLGGLLPLARFFRQEHFDIIHVHGARAAAYAAGAMFTSSSSRRIASIHELDCGSNSRRIFRVMENILYRNIYHQIICVSEACLNNAQAARHIQRAKLRRIYNGVPATLAVKKDGKHRIIGGLGRFNHAKGFDILLKAFHRIAEKDPQAELLLAGDGPERAALEQIAASGAGLGRIHFKGVISNVVEFMKAIDLIVIPSRTESFGLAAIEALANGVPVIASNIDGLAEVLGQGEYGVLVDRVDPESLADAILKLMNDGALQDKLIQAGTTRAKQFCIDECARQHIDLYQQALAAR